MLYVMRLELIPGVQASEEQVERHKEHLRAKHEAGKIFAAGRTQPGSGLVVFQAESLDEARALAEEDPFIKEGVRTYQLWEWYADLGQAIK